MIINEDFLGTIPSDIETNKINLNALRGANLLWTNPNPTSNFAAQTINIANLANYNTVIVVWNNATTGSARIFCMAYKGYQFEMQDGHVGSGGTEWRRRLGLVNDTSVQFDTAYVSQNYGSKSPGTSSTNVCIPLCIYGLNTIFNL